MTTPAPVLFVPVGPAVKLQGEAAPRTAVYVIKNDHNGDFYVGISVDPGRRWQQHTSNWNVKQAKNKLQRAFHKYGIETFHMDVLGWCEFRDEAKLAEIKLIALLKPKYNATKGGDGCWGAKRSAETRKLMSDAQRGKKRSEEVRANISKIQKGKPKKPRTAEHIANLSAALMGHEVSPEVREKISKKLTGQPGRPLSDLTKEKISLAHTGKPKPSPSAETRALISQKLTGIIRSPETRAKMSAARCARQEAA